MSHLKPTHLLIAALTAWLMLDRVSPTSAAPEATADEAWFVERVQPILQRRCFSCHSHAAGKISGGLALDSRSGWVEGGDSGPAIKSGRPQDSLLIQAVKRTGLEMPPDEPLPASEVAVLVEWVEKGTPDPRRLTPERTQLADTQWWSLLPLAKVAIPEASSSSTASTAIDRFLVKSLQRQQLATTAPADRRTLYRRLLHDLHGLPPSPEELDEFLADDDPSAFERCVDRLLASPRYGERWARHWFDTIHFAETHGYEHDVFRGNAWRYRDYVIESLNRDTDWGRFVREQLAADVFFPNEPQLTAALGFLGAGTFDLSTYSTAPVTFDYLDRDDMVTQTMSALASATANCARCHDHKFDPISQEDYYALQAVFAGIAKGDISYDADPQIFAARRRWLDLKAAADRRDPSVLLDASHQPLVAAWERANTGGASVWSPLALLSYSTSQGSTLRQLPEGPLVAEGTRPEREVYTVVGRIPDRRVASIRLDVLSHDSLPMKGPGRQDNGNLHLNEVELYVRGAVDGELKRLKIVRATSDWDQMGWTVAHAIDGNAATAWGIYPKVGQSHVAVFEVEQPWEPTPQAELTVVLHQSHGGGHLIGRFQLSTSGERGVKATPLSSDVEEALRTAVDARTEAQRLTIAAHVLRERADDELARLPPPVKVYAAAAAVELNNNPFRLAAPKPVHLLKRGDIHKPGPLVPPGAINALGHLPGRFPVSDQQPESVRRAALADWLVHPKNPLTWRSIVNRVWHYHFGRGICDTPSDFGRMGALPTHPELLDWLTSEFQREGGFLKRLHRELLTTDAYRRSSDFGEGQRVSAELDPDNRFLWRGQRRRLDAEAYRDAVLAVSGRLDLAMGGPSIQHFKTSPGAQLTPKLDYDAYEWEGTGAGRREVYRFQWRGIADPFLESLDLPDAALLQPVRSQSASALQALAVFNNDFVLRHSVHLAQRLEKSGSTDLQRAQAASRLVWLRELTPEESRVLVDYAKGHGWPSACRVLLNSSEFLFVD